jgi:hypothetical protein
MKTSTEASNGIAERALVVASLRQVLAHLAVWTNLMFGDGASARLAKVADFPTGDIRDFITPGSGGRLTERSPLVGLVAQAYDFVTSGAWSGTRDDLDTALGDLTPLEALLRQETSISDQRGDTHFDLDGVSRLLNVLDRAWARFALAHERPVTLPQLAVLAGLAEKTVRMLAKAERKGKQIVRDDPNIYTHKAGTRTWVGCAEAHRWLGLRPDFKPTRFGTINLEPRTQLALASTLRQLREKVKLEIPELVKRCALPAETETAYEDLEFGWWGPELDIEAFEVPALKRLAMALGVKQPAPFVQAIAEILAPFKIQRQIEMAGK